MESIHSNCSLLELRIQRGINKEDIEERNEVYKDYIDVLRLYQSFF